MPENIAHFLLGFTLAHKGSAIPEEIQTLFESQRIVCVFTVHRMMTQEESDSEARRLLTQSRGCEEIFLSDK